LFLILNKYNASSFPFVKKFFLEFFWILCAIAVFVGGQIGSRFMAEKLKPRSVKLVFGWILLGVSLLLIVKHVL